MPSLLNPMSRKTDSPVTTNTVPTSCFPPPSLLREWLFSYCERSSPNDSPDSAVDSAVSWDSGTPGLDMIESGSSQENGRHEETRTPDLYRVNACRLRISRT